MPRDERIENAIRPLVGDPSRITMSRREALHGGLALAAAGFLPVVLGACRSGNDDTESSPEEWSPGIALPQPVVHRSQSEVLAVTLTAAPAAVDIGAPQPVRTFAYDARLPGSTWELRPGQVLRVELVNQLPPLKDADHTGGLDRPHEWTHTNLHTHGLHVSPEGDGDNVFVTIEPGSAHHYEIEVPPDHPGGTFWYHPHRHGGVAQQVRGGMAGMIIVRGEIDRVPEIAAAREQVVVIQAIEIDSQFQVAPPIPDPSASQAFFPRSQILYPVNGVLAPTITMYPGEVQRWRILNAAEGKFIDLVLDGHEFDVVAWDGLSLGAPEPAPNVFLSGGNRVDVLVQAGRPGRYSLMLTPSSSQHPGTQGVPSATTTSTVPDELATRPIATLVVEGEGAPMTLPTSLPVWDPPILPIARRRTVTYTVERAGQEFLDFGVDGEAFQPDRAPYQVPLGTAEEWTIVNGVDAKLPQHAHVFHIHVNPFKVTHINGRELDRPRWRDTFILTGANGDSFTFVSNFVDFTGRYVDHCHVLSHEDLGMMEIVEVVR